MAEESQITIVLAEDHLVVRSGLRMLLEAEDRFEVVAEPRAMSPRRCAAFAREALRSGFPVRVTDSSAAGWG